MSVRVPFLRGGAELHACKLQRALQEAGHEPDVVTMPFFMHAAELIPRYMESARLIDLNPAADLVIASKFPAYFVQHRRKVVWLLHQHRAAYDLWGKPFGDLHHAANGAAVRETIWRADAEFFRGAPSVFTISRNVSRRLRASCGVEAEAIYHPPPGHETFYSTVAEDYVFFPSRISAMKRQYLVIAALVHTREHVRVRFGGVADSPRHLRELQAFAEEQGVTGRVEFLGPMSESEKRDLYARSLAVVYPPFDEDYGYITLEAMLASKAVLTCTDSGGPLEFVRHRETGLVVQGNPKDLAAGLDWLWQNRAQTARLGKAGREVYESLQLSWPKVVARLLGE